MAEPAEPDVPNDVLENLYRDPTVDSCIAPEFAAALYRLVRREQPRSVLEIGLAHGASALAILTALEENGVGRLISIDPHQSGDGGWRGAGVANIKAAGLAHRHQLIEEPDFLALPDLVRADTRVQLVYIDGWHTFDYALLDFFYADKLLDVGGLVGFNDCFYPSIERVLRFVTRHRRYRAEDVGLGPMVVIRRRGRLPLARWTGHRRNAADQYFRKSHRLGAELRLLGRVLTTWRDRRRTSPATRAAVEVALAV